MTHLCYYGCGQETKFQFKNGKWCCSKNIAQCLIIRKKLSDVQSGENNPRGMLNKHHSKTSKEKSSKKQRTPFEENVKFTVAYGDGVKPIIEPPPETYFDWSKSPILAQFKYIVEIEEKIKDYKYSELPTDAMLVDRIKIAPWFNVFDFWWLYRYILEQRYSGFIVAMFMFLLAMFSLSRLWKAVR